MATVCFSGVAWEHSQDTDFQPWKTKCLRNWNLKQHRWFFIALLIFLQACSTWLNYWSPTNLIPLQSVKRGHWEIGVRMSTSTWGANCGGCLQRNSPTIPAGTSQPYSHTFTNIQAGIIETWAQKCEDRKPWMTKNGKNPHLLYVTLPTIHMLHFTPYFSRSLVSSISTYFQDHLKPSYLWC